MKAGGDRSWSKRKTVVLLVAAAAFAALAWYVRNHVSLPELVEREQRVREAIAEKPWRSFALGLAIYAVVSLVPGTSGKSIVFAWLYGFWQGVLIIILGLTAAATVIFHLSRYVFRAWIEHRYGKFLAALNRHLQKEGAFYLLTLRMAHFPFSIVNLASGASRVRLRTFCWTTALGLLPGTVIFAYVGIRLPSLDELAKQGAAALVDPLILVALAISAVFPLVFRWAARKLGFLKASSAELDEERQLLKP
ncbi:MAG: TVP38/TMEM64 family protein [Akkermansiaceae bacterium]|nr:TVP38/TMEM64 family protein [Akkermansiaceae bacterium]NNM30538.1 TVP38/TMEM64 family protein [Akkermansiaceae bacterium]